MLRITIAVLILSCVGCKHHQVRTESKFPPLEPPKADVKEEPKQKVVNITLLRVENFTIKAF